TSPRRPVKDADDVSSIFASTDAEDGGPEASSPGAGRSPSEKAALLERARREIDDFDEQEGVGLLDQTPELSYRTASQFSRAGVDTGKNRARSSSNTVVRMLTDIVRDTGGSGPGVRAGKAVQSLVGLGGGTLDAAGNDIMDDIEVAPPRADEYLKPVFLKGLFSVATTSTRSPTVIRANLLSVLGGMPLRFHEGKGYFTCSMATAGGPANIQEDALDAYTQPDPEASHNSSLHKLKRPLRLPVVDRRISFRRRSKRLDEAPLAPALPTDALHGHDDASSNEGNTSDARQSGAESAGERASSRPQPSVKHKPAADAICFQIFLVRMPLLGLHGLQFRRVSGPAWRYKDACSEILKQLKL
ncbi:Serine/threonine-protein kinase, partial [Coemansia nantahalensis]